MSINRIPNSAPTVKDKRRFFLIRVCLSLIVVPSCLVYHIIYSLSTFLQSYRVTENFFSKMLFMDSLLLKLFPRLFYRELPPIDIEQK